MNPASVKHLTPEIVATMRKHLAKALTADANCKHENVRLHFDTNKDGTMAVLHCKDCTMTLIVHPDELDEPKKEETTSLKGG